MRYGRQANPTAVIGHAVRISTLRNEVSEQVPMEIDSGQLQYFLIRPVLKLIPKSVSAVKLRNTDQGRYVILWKIPCRMIS